MNHDSFVVFWYSVKSLLNNMASKSIHTETQGVTTDSVGDSDDLLRRSMLEAALHEEIPEAIHHQWVSLSDNGLDDFILLFNSADFEFLLKEYRRLLVIVAHDLVNDILPVTCYCSVKEAAIVERLHRRNVCLSRR